HYRSAMPNLSVEERVESVESALSQFLRRTDEAFARQDTMLARHDVMIGELHRDIQEMRTWRLTSQQQMNELAGKIAVVAENTNEMREWRLESQKRWGEIAQKIGSFVEDIVVPNIPRIAREVFALGGPEDEVFSGPRLRVRHPEDPSR